MNLKQAIRAMIAGLCVVGLGTVTACGDFDGTVEQTEPEYGQAEQELTTLLGENSSTWGIEGSSGSLSTKCSSLGSVNQNCYMVRPAQVADPGGSGAPARYKVTVLGTNYGPTGGNPIKDAVVFFADKISTQLNQPTLPPAQVLVDYAGAAAVPIGINITGGTVAGNNGTQTDSYFRIVWNGCGAILGELNPVAGSYRLCDRADVTVDIARLRANFSGTTGVNYQTQLIAKVILSALGAGRQEVTSGFPTNRLLGTMQYSSGGQVLTISEKKQLLCVGFTAIRLPNFAIGQTTISCGLGF